MDRPLTTDLHFPTSQSPDGFRVGQFLLLKNKCCQFVGRTEVGNGDGSLQNNGPVVVFVVGKVNSAAADLHTATYGSLMNMMSIQSMAAKRRDQRRMNVQYPPAKIVRNAEQTEESGKCDQIDLSITQCLKNCRTEFLRI